jgi:hypothetical protein
LQTFFLEWGILWTKPVEKIKTDFTFTEFLFPENRAIYELMSKNMVKQEDAGDKMAQARAHTHTHTQTQTQTKNM